MLIKSHCIIYHIRALDVATVSISLVKTKKGMLNMTFSLLNKIRCYINKNDASFLKDFLNNIFK